MPGVLVVATVVEREQPLARGGGGGLQQAQARHGIRYVFINRRL